MSATVQRITATGALDVSMSMSAWRQVLLADPCAYCGAPSRDVDHIVPTASRGADDHTNLTGSCLRCNRRKKSRTLLDLLHSADPIGPNPEYKIRGIHYDMAHRPELLRQSQREREREDRESHYREVTFCWQCFRKYGKLPAPSTR